MSRPPPCAYRHRVTSSRREHPRPIPGAHRVHQRRTAAHYDPYLDGLFTYCLSVMCEHEAATAALGEALAAAERQRERGRRPSDRSLHRPWLYALARWACLRRLTEQRAGGTEHTGPRVPGPMATERRRELAALAWPEASGTTPEQREALELAVRHQLPADGVAAVLGLEPSAVGALLSSAACEVERTRAALAVVESAGCPAVTGLGNDRDLLLGAALRRELVRHVDTCTRCRRIAERAMSDGPWPGTAPAGSGVLTVLRAPRQAVREAMTTALRSRAQHLPRFDRRGFPVGTEDRSARRERLRNRAVTTTVVATVLAAPVLAVWAAYRGAPLTGEGHGTAPVSASDADEQHHFGGRPPGRAGGPHPGHRPSATRPPGAARSPSPSRSPHGETTPAPDPPRAGTGDGTGTAGRLAVRARPHGGGTLLTLTASGTAPVAWSARTDARWLRLSRTEGTLRPGDSVTVTVSVDRGHEPAGPWTARIRISPAGSAVTVEGHGATPDAADPGPTVRSAPPAAPSGSPSPTATRSATGR